MYRHSRTFRWLVLPALGMMFWFFSSAILLINSDFSPTVVTFDHRDNSELMTVFSELGSGDVMQRSFVARENYLGIVALHFQKESPVVGKFIFKLRPHDSQEWTVVNEYDSRQFYYLTHFPFGFPVISDSKGKKFDIEVQFLSSNAAHRKHLKIEQSTLQTKYKFPKTFLLSNSQFFIQFVEYKFLAALRDQQLVLSLVFNSVPLIFIILTNVLFELKVHNKTFWMEHFLQKVLALYRTYLKRYTPFPFFLFLIFALLESLLFLRTNSYIVSLVVLVWSYYIYRMKLKSTTSVLFLFMLAVLGGPTIVLGIEHIAEKLSVYFLVFSVILFIQLSLENRKSRTGYEH